MLETNICQYYPHWFRRILDFQALCHTESQELRFLAAAMEQIHKNLFVQTMDEDTCAQWETILRIVRTPGEDLDFRRLGAEPAVTAPAVYDDLPAGAPGHDFRPGELCGGDGLPQLHPLH